MTTHLVRRTLYRVRYERMDYDDRYHPVGVEPTEMAQWDTWPTEHWFDASGCRWYLGRGVYDSPEAAEAAIGAMKRAEDEALNMLVTFA